MPETSPHVVQILYFHVVAVKNLQNNRLAYPLWELVPPFRKFLDPPLPRATLWNFSQYLIERFRSRRLRELNVEGNQLPALSYGCLKLPNLKYLRVRNNFMHPLFWKESTQNQPQVYLLTNFKNHRYFQWWIYSLSPIHTERKRKISLMFSLFCSLSEIAFAWCK